MDTVGAGLCSARPPQGVTSVPVILSAAKNLSPVLAGDHKGRPYVPRRKSAPRPPVLASLVKGRGTAKRW